MSGNKVTLTLDAITMQAIERMTKKTGLSNSIVAKLIIVSYLVAMEKLPRSVLYGHTINN
jgi:hypothetical protein